jgi:hypothetical protein
MDERLCAAEAQIQGYASVVIQHVGINGDAWIFISFDMPVRSFLPTNAVTAGVHGAAMDSQSW